MSNPTWANHGSIFQAAGLKTEVYPYLTVDKQGLDIEGMLSTLAKEGRRGDLVCLHACCHNPTGIDPTLDQWQEISGLLAEKGMLPFIDFAYQGFGDGLVEDAKPIHVILDKNSEAIICSSYSKNFGVYSERVGALMFVNATSASREATLSQIRNSVRCCYSNPPRHGASTVATILNDASLRAEWHQEVIGMRTRISQMRSQFIAGMKQTGVDRDFAFLSRQKGMFSYSGLTSLQVDWLKKERAIYIVNTGRMNVAGMAASSMKTLCDAVAECLEATVPV